MRSFQLLKQSKSHPASRHSVILSLFLCRLLIIVIPTVWVPHCGFAMQFNKNAHAHSIRLSRISTSNSYKILVFQEASNLELYYSYSIYYNLAVHKYFTYCCSLDCGIEGRNVTMRQSPSSSYEYGNLVYIRVYKDCF
jgi:hypothetical protein